MRVALASTALCGALQAHGQAAPPPDPGDLLHRVVVGDTLIALSRTLLEPGRGWRALQRLNAVADPRRLVPGSVLRLPAAWLRSEPAVAEVVHVRGEVLVERAGTAVHAAAPGAAMRAGDLLRAGSDASLTLRLADGARLLLRPGSQLRLVRLRQQSSTGRVETGLGLDQGSVDSRVPPTGRHRYEIDTPTVHLGVRGTEFRARVEGGSNATHVEVIDGSVAATLGRTEQRLAAGEGGTAAAGAARLTTAALAAPPDLAALPERVERVPLNLAWPARASVRTWHAQVVDAAAPDVLLLQGRFDAPAARWPDLPDGRYELRVRAVDLQGLEGLDARRAFTLKARPFPPFTAQPRAGATVHGDAVRLGWTLAEGVAAYRVQLSRQEPGEPDDAAFAKPSIDRLVAAAGLDEALPPGRYAWRVASVRADGDQGPFGDAQAFTLRPLPAAPPLQPAQVDGDALVLRWPAGAPGERYELQLARDAGFAQVLRTVETAEPEAVLPRPEPGTWFVRVRAVDSDGVAGPYGGTQQIDVPRSRWWWLVPAGLLLLVL